jgi:hypothetical protein
VLARVDRRRRHLDVRRRDREVDDQLDVRVRQHVLGRTPPLDVVGLRLGLRAYRVDVADDEHAHVGEARQVGQVGVADHPGADQADADRAGTTLLVLDGVVHGFLLDRWFRPAR